MTSAKLHIVLIDPWIQTPVDIGWNRTQAISRALALAGHAVTWLAGKSQAPDSGSETKIVLKSCLQPLERRFGFAAVGVPTFGYGFGLLWALRGIDQTDIIIVRHPPLAGALALALYSLLSGVPILVDADTLAPEKIETGFFARLAGRFRFMVLRRTAVHVFAAAPDIKAWFEAQRFPPAGITVDPNGCDSALFAGARDKPSDIFVKYPQLNYGPLLLYAGRLNRGRPIAELLEIAAALRVIGSDARIVIVGDGPDRLDLNAYASRLDVLEKNVWFLPAQPRSVLATLMNAATLGLALTPQRFEGGLEAGSHIFDGLAAGKPIAVLGDGWQRELIEGRQAGLALPAKNPEAAARELADFLRDGDLVRRAGEQANALARGKYNTERTMAEIRHRVEKIAVRHSRHDVARRRSAFAKRTFDILAAFVALAILSPVLVLISIVLMTSGHLPIAGRARSGQRGKPFKLYTFDTMMAAGSGPTSWRSTFANFLRRSALDRLPELFNVVLGDMSLTGPRPLPAEYATYYTEAQQRRLDVRPGLTGWAQVNGRKGLTWDEMFAHDIWYVEHRTFWLDVKILLRTFFGLFLGHGAAPLPAGQMPRFDEIEARRQGAEDA
ncbi:MAG: glycosyltransferase [Rhodospirillaceae bacterium]|nr:glycosyltransferase [Rhodospirillaceae bacterium]